MNKFKFIIKGILLWTTGFVTVLFVVGVDSIYDNRYFFQTLIAIVVMIFCCYKLISEKEFEVLSLYKWFNEECRFATDEDKQQLFEALAKENKAWDAEKKAIVDLKPKCEFKPFDRCIWKIRNCEGSIWQASFVSYVDEYGAIPMGISIDEDLVNLIILPYNAETAKLIGTTDNWEGLK